MPIAINSPATRHSPSQPARSNSPGGGAKSGAGGLSPPPRSAPQSRRGRSRSPVVLGLGSRLPPPSSDPPSQLSSPAGSSGLMPGAGPGGSDNPSSVAAAAAAAAKSLSSGGSSRAAVRSPGPPQSWGQPLSSRNRDDLSPGSPPPPPPPGYYSHHRRHHHHHPPPPQPPPPSSYSSASNWPDDSREGRSSSSHRYSGSSRSSSRYSHYDYPSPQHPYSGSATTTSSRDPFRRTPSEDPYGDATPASASRSRSYHPSSYQQHHHHHHPRDTSPYRSSGRHGSQPPPRPPSPYEDERSRRGRSSMTGESDRGPPPPSSSTPPQYNAPEFRYGQNPREARGSSTNAATPGGSSSTSKRSSSGGGGGGTSLIIGGTTPIHVPKRGSARSTEPLPAIATTGSDRSLSKSGNGHSTERPMRGVSASTVFRSRPGDASGGSPAAPAGGAGEDDDSPQNILLSLRTPTTSFEERGSDKGSSSGSGGGMKSSGLTLSPADEPVPMQNFQRGSADPIFDRSPDPTLKNTTSIDMAPSFALFSQSFDSFGDGGYFNVESTLHTDSFGVARTGSLDNDGTTQLLQSNLSTGMLAPSGSGIGYSPVNSWEGPSTTIMSRRSGNMMILGGPDQRAASPLQVLGMYRSYSGGGGSGAPPAPLEDSHLRTSVGSFGARSMSYGGRPYPSDPPSPCDYYHSMGPSRSQEIVDRTPPFYSFLRKYRAAFKDCLFLLPGLKAALLESPLDVKEGEHASPVTVDGTAKVQKWDSPVKAVSAPPTYLGPPSHGMYSEPTPQDIAVARRRVESSVCAFGGNLNAADRKSEETRSSGRTGIFRGKTEQENTASATVTPSSSTGSPQGARFNSRSKIKYDEELPSRYYENESRLSWEFEENPPVEISQEEGEKNENEDSESKDDGSQKDNKRSEEGGNKSSNESESGKRTSASSPQPKMRYRCKLCGQPKQNHTCPYQQSLARSIGIMVYPAVNAFTAAEPGTVAPALSEMNNFIDIQKESSSNESSPGRPTPDRMGRISTGATVTSTTQVTPETLRSSPRQLQSPASFASPSQSSRTPSRRNAFGRRVNSLPGTRKRSHAQLSAGVEDQGDLLFLDAMEIKPQQFVTVSITQALSRPEAFNYPSLPLPYAQRKRLSDNLFSLSNEVPKLTDECAQVLREAREKDLWDLAVSELMTQVIVIIHCPDGDNRFEGLRQYLLTLGIAC